MSVYLVQSSIHIVLPGEAGGHHTPPVTLKRTASSNYFWQREGGRVLQFHTHFKDTCKLSTSTSAGAYVYFSGTGTTLCRG